ncbi:MAG: helix-turn-helix domain-containing protein, partial [Myxococcales bacterium]|nr:helix-turn-helix domain-containing protein [Myxococcales bacterium]
MNRWANAHKTSQQLLSRIQIILLASTGLSNVEIGAELGMTDQRAGRWRNRWVALQSRLAEAETQGASEKDLIAAHR